jgi:hypothetical protein
MTRACSAWSTIGAQKFFECIHALGPTLLVVAQPLGAGAHRRGIELADVHTALHRAAYEPGVLENFDVLGSRRETHRTGRRELADGLRTRCELLEHRAASAVGQRVKECIDGGLRIVNHVVEYNNRLPFSQLDG